MANPKKTQIYERQIFSAPAERCDRFSKIVLKYAPKKEKIRILDLGCGTGEQVASLANLFPQSEVFGVDISEQNIDKAKTKNWKFKDRVNVEFIATDIMKYDEEHFDIIISYSTFHLIHIPSHLLIKKISSLLRPGGVFINVIPYGCRYNNWLFRLRRLFIKIRSPKLDEILHFFGSLLLRNRMSPDLVKERVMYMYLLPQCLYDCDFRHMLSIYGDFQVEKEFLEVHASWAQPKHKVIISVKNELVE